MKKKKEIEKKPDLDVMKYAIEQIKGRKYTPNTITYYENGKWITKDCKDYCNGK